jgi:hypothetical protein
VNRLAALLLATCMLAPAGDLKLKVILDTTDPGVYNRWVWQHRAKCPGFKHVYMTCDSWVRRGKFECPAVSFWTDSGPLFVHCILPDSQLAPSPVQARGPILDISSNTGQLTVRSGRDSFAMYDRFGTRLFADPSRPEALMSGRWLTIILHPFRDVLLDDNGKVLSTISSSGIPRVLHADDSVFLIHDNDGTVALFDRDGHELWRSRRLVGSRSAFAVAPNARSVAASTDDSLVIFSPLGSEVVALPHDKEWKHFGWPMMTWSSDSRRLAIYQGSTTAWDSGRVFVVNTEGGLVRPIRRMQLYCVRALVWMGDTLVFPALGEDVSKRSYSSADSCVVSFVPSRGRIRRGVVHGKFRLHGEWNASGRHLAFVSPPAHFVVAELVR